MLTAAEEARVVKAPLSCYAVMQDNAVHAGQL